jgi:IclR family transcriptional regulator, KDG regulon repressor
MKIGKRQPHYSSGTQAIDRALEVLSSFDFATPEWGASDLSRRLGLTISTTQRILKALEAKNFLVINKETKKYEIGLKVFALGSVAYNRIRLLELTQNILIRLHDETKQTVNLAIVDGDEMFYIKHIESSDVFRIHSPVGYRRPLTGGSLGKAILSTYSKPALDQFFSRNKLIPFTKNSIIDTRLYLKELKIVKDRGYATDKEERFEGACGVAAPLCDVTGVAIGAITIVFPAMGYTEERMSEYGELVRQAGLSVSVQLMHRDGIQGNAR